MSRPNPIVLFAILALFSAAIGGLLFAKGGLFVTSHEGDSYHLLDIIFRMEMGQKPHVDFVTPLGIFAFLPIVMFIQAGFGVGTAILLSQILVAAVLLPLLVYVGWSRMSRAVAIGFGIATLWLVLALTYGTADANLSISMHYNRWAWAISFIVIALVLLPPLGRPWPIVDGLIIGVLMATVVLLKITYFVGLAPAVLVALLMQKRTRTLIWAVSGGLIVAAIMMALNGLGFWLSYVSDLLNVTGSEVRPHTGVDLSDIIAGPKYAGGLIAALAMVYFLRKAGDQVSAVALLLLVPGFVYITWQNSGNDPQWLIVLVMLALMFRPAEDADLSRKLSGVAIAAAALFFPSALNLALSPVKHYTMPESLFEPMIPRLEAHHDMRIVTLRGNSTTAEVALDVPGSVWEPYGEIIDRPAPLELAGATFPHCEIMAGTAAYFKEHGDAMKAAGVPAGSQIFTTDILAAFWLFDDHFAPLKQGAPWYYGELTGIENADYVLVPKCTFVSRVRGIMIGELNDSGIALSLVADNELFALYKTP